MTCFTYGSRIIENERQVKLNKHVSTLGNLLHATVTFFVTFFLFILLNCLLSNLVQHAHLTFVKMLHLVTESAETLLSQGAMSAVYFSHNQTLYVLVLALAFSCVYQFGVVFKALYNGDSDVDQQQESLAKTSYELHTEEVAGAVSYRYKVCFLS